MQVILDVKQEKDFINMNLKTKLFLVFLGLSAIGLQQCKKSNVIDNTTDFFTPVQVKAQLNLNLPQYIFLTQPQGYVYIPEGNKGIVVYHLPQGGYMAYDRTCSFNPAEQCASVSMDRNYANLKCGSYANDTTFVFNVCCGSEFELNNGTAVKKPAILPLKQYFTSYDEQQKILYISNTPF